MANLNAGPSHSTFYTTTEVLELMEDDFETDSLDDEDFGEPIMAGSDDDLEPDDSEHLRYDKVQSITVTCGSFLLSNSVHVLL